MTPLRSNQKYSRPPRLETDFFKMLGVSVLLHLLLVAFYLTPFFQRAPVVAPPVYRVNLVNAPVLDPQAGRPEAAPQPPAPEPAPPAPVREPEPIPAPAPVPPPPPAPEPEPELIPGPTPEELERERLAEEQRKREEAERQRRLAEAQRQREEAEKKRLAEEQRQREEAEKRRLAEEQRQREEAERQRRAEQQRQLEDRAREQRLTELAEQRQREEDERERQARLDALRAAARAQAEAPQSPIPDAPVGMPDGRGSEAGVSPSDYVKEFIRQNWTFSRGMAVGNPEAVVRVTYNAAGIRTSFSWVSR
jgi:TolA protein